MKALLLVLLLGHNLPDGGSDVPYDAPPDGGVAYTIGYLSDGTMTLDQQAQVNIASYIQSVEKGRDQAASERNVCAAVAVSAIVVAAALGAALALKK